MRDRQKERERQRQRLSENELLLLRALLKCKHNSLLLQKHWQAISFSNSVTAAALQFQESSVLKVFALEISNTVGGALLQ